MKWMCCLLLLIPIAAPAQEPPPEGDPPGRPCTESAYRAFDFWLGEWSVTADGQPAGSNSIVSILDGCALQENWQGAGAGGLSGKSLNVYDRATDRWHQTWIDSSGTLLELNGGIVDGAMVLTGERPAPDGKGSALHRISWTPNEDGSVRQLWEVSRDDGASWTVLFDGLYVKAAAEE